MARRFGLCTLAVIASLGATPDARAGLGQKADSIERDRVTMRASTAVRTTKATSFVVHEIRRGDLVVKEFAAADGTVFAVTWDGPIRPDVPALLGDYFKKYQEAAAPTHDGRTAPMRASTADIDVISAGRMGHFYGRAVAKPLLPTGVTTEDLK